MGDLPVETIIGVFHLVVPGVGLAMRVGPVQGEWGDRAEGPAREQWSTITVDFTPAPLFRNAPIYLTFAESWINSML